MGQLERYGLYVLCIVIFLILGVAIWGGDAVVAAPGVPHSQLQQPARAAIAKEAPVVIGPLESTLAVQTKEDEPEKRPSASGGAQPEQGQPGPDKTPPAEARPAAREPIAYVVKKNDNLFTLAEQQCKAKPRDQAACVERIRELNPGIQPERLGLGITLLLPPAPFDPAWRPGAKTASGTARTEPAAPGTDPRPPARSARKELPAVHVVQHGETVSNIAQAYYGSTRHAGRILTFNKIEDERRIREGTKLTIPKLD